MPAMLWLMLPYSTYAHGTCNGLDEDFMHSVVDHTVEYVRKQVIHIISLENFWSLLKRTLKGTYVSVDVVH